MRVACGACAPVVVIDSFRVKALLPRLRSAERHVLFSEVVSFSRRGSMLLGARVWRSPELARKARGPS